MSERVGCFRTIRARHVGELSGADKKTINILWNAAFLVLSSAALCGVCLWFAIGKYDLFYIFLGYFRNPEIFILNWLPLLILQTVLYAVFNSQAASFLVTGIAALLMSLGNYFKLAFRNDPFSFDDLSSIRAGLSVAGEYPIQVTWQIALAFFCVAAGCVAIFLFARLKMNAAVRFCMILFALTSAWFLWNRVYTDYDRYYENSYSNFLFITRDKRDSFIANGFFYPFLFSITESSNIPPDGYDEQQMEALYAEFSGTEIPAERKVNIMVIQLESFCDLEAMGLTGISESVYEPLRLLQRESVSGVLVPSVIGGGTVTTERSVLTGAYRQQDFYKPAYSYIRYLNSQGYLCTASHPNVPYFYARNTINEYLGFDEFYHLENYFQDLTGGEWRCDEQYLPEIFRMFCEQCRKETGAVFSFNVSLQGHSPYHADMYDRETDLWTMDSVSDGTRILMNNYLSLIAETQRILMEQTATLLDEPEPMVLLIYGDHKPWFGDEVYEELNLKMSMDTEQGMLDYLGTPYLIWANAAARDQLQNEFAGEGIVTSPGYLMNILFNQLGWKGPAFMQYTETVREMIPVICMRGGYLEEGKYVQELSEKGIKLLSQYQSLFYYLHYRPELAEVTVTAA